MSYPTHRTPAFARRRPELPAFCRTRRQLAITVPLGKLQRLERLLWLALLFQLSTLLLLVSLLPSPAHVSSSTSSSTTLERGQRQP